jgi:hypothetical protein
MSGRRTERSGGPWVLPLPRKCTRRTRTNLSLPALCILSTTQALRNRAPSRSSSLANPALPWGKATPSGEAPLIPHQPFGFCPLGRMPAHTRPTQTANPRSPRPCTPRRRRATGTPCRFWHPLCAGARATSSGVDSNSVCHLEKPGAATAVARSTVAAAGRAQIDARLSRNADWLTQLNTMSDRSWPNSHAWSPACLARLRRGSFSTSPAKC